MAASRLLRAVAAFVILLSFAAGSRKSSWSACCSFVRGSLGSAAHSQNRKLQERTNHGLVQAWSRHWNVLGEHCSQHGGTGKSRCARPGCAVILFASCCMKAATVICQQIFSIFALVIFLLKILLKSASKSSFFRSGVEIRFWSYNFRRRCA